MSASMKHRPARKQGNRGKYERGPVSRRPDDGVPTTPASPTAWTPSVGTAFKALLSARLCSAIWSHITDCDETFNYWEPLNFLLNGHGFQTWEYSPVYAIRSYAYIWLYALPLKLYAAITQGNTIFQFYFLRLLLALFCALCETFFYRSVHKHFGASVSRLVLCFLVLSPGMFISSTAFLPSSFSMYMTLVAVGAWYSKRLPLAVFAIAASTIIAWPFAGALGIPIAYDIVVRRKLVGSFILWSVISGLVCLVPLVAVDSHYYGKLVIAPLNIIVYNVFSEHGPDIYGVEPWSFYFVNGFLNFNFVFPLALVALPALMVLGLVVTLSKHDIPLWLSLGPMYIWIAIFFTRPHKEERFLFPIYPLICLAGALMLDYTQRFIVWLVAINNARNDRSFLTIAFCIGFGSLSISRSVALYKGYHAPLDTYTELHQLSSDPKFHDLPSERLINVCVGKEWYRFPNNMFLPSDRWRLQFVKSQFRGQLPKMYEKSPNATRIIPTHMNDVNLEEPTRYVELSQCHYLIDLDIHEENPHEPRYSQNTKDWRKIASSTFLDNQKSHQIFRAFYVPILYEKHCTFIDYVVLQSRNYKDIKLKS